MLAIEPVRLARRQVALDRARVAAFPSLLERKVARMTASPLAFLRGSAPLFYRMLRRDPALAEGPPGEGWLVGDAHLENFGAFRTGRDDDEHEAKVVFDLNDFDDAVVGPWRYDVLRLLTSLLIGGRELGVDGVRALSLGDALLDAYQAASTGGALAAEPPAAVTRLVERVRDRSRKQLLDDRTAVVGGERRFARGQRYEPLAPELIERARAAFARYAESMVEAAHVRGNAKASPGLSEKALRPFDFAFRVAGTGSLGGLRIAVLTRGKGGRDGAWIFDMKAAGTPSACERGLVTLPSMAPAERVHTALVACLAHPPRMVGVARFEERRGEGGDGREPLSFVVRRLSPQEDKLDLTKLAPTDLEPLARLLGARLGSAHRRGATRRPPRAWSTAERRGVLARAIALAGAHEAIYLAYCDEVRRDATH